MFYITLVHCRYYLNIIYLNSPRPFVIFIHMTNIVFTNICMPSNIFLIFAHLVLNCLSAGHFSHLLFFGSRVLFLIQCNKLGVSGLEACQSTWSRILSQKGGLENMGRKAQMIVLWFFSTWNPAGQFRKKTYRRWLNCFVITYHSNDDFLETPSILTRFLDKHLYSYILIPICKHSFGFF